MIAATGQHSNSGNCCNCSHQQFVQLLQQEEDYVFADDLAIWPCLSLFLLCSGQAMKLFVKSDVTVREKQEQAVPPHFSCSINKACFVFHNDVIRADMRICCAG